ncbi:Unknown protein sequence [Pseudomonas syringae pv. maculicola]|nr:Unknown protein sequence [Pseudomonas syringae pv. maculicola]
MAIAALYPCSAGMTADTTSNPLYSLRAMRMDPAHKSKREF